MESRDRTIDTRCTDAFFYGLFMDVDVLRAHDVEPANPRRACVDGFALRIGRRATLLPRSGARAYGMLITLSCADLDRLYAGSDLTAYRAETVLARLLTGGSAPALCYNLPRAPEAHERNSDYVARLQAVLRKLDFPADYVASLA
ncbi:MAG: hypothetical protein ACJ8NR_07755 [Sulfurifustis sp.]